MTTDEMYDYLVGVVGVSEETIQIVTSINGYSTETMEDILYAVTGYRDFDQYMEECDPCTVYTFYDKFKKEKFSITTESEKAAWCYLADTLGTSYVMENIERID